MAKESERGIVDIETLKKEGHDKRMAAEHELVKIENENHDRPSNAHIEQSSAVGQPPRSCGGLSPLYIFFFHI